MWIDIVVKLTPAFITLVLGSFGIYIAYGQFKTNRDRLRLDLFEKRLEAYEKLQEYFNLLMREGRVNDGAIPILHEARYKSVFLFDQDINDHIEEVWEKAFEMRNLMLQMYGPDALPVGDERSKVCQKESDLLRWNLDQQKNSPQRYAKYLKFN